MTYGRALGLQVVAFYSEGDNSEKVIEREINEWIHTHPNADVIDISFQLAIVPAAPDSNEATAPYAYPFSVHSALLVYRETGAA